MFSQVFVHNRSHGYSFIARPCYGAVGTHPTGMLSLFLLHMLVKGMMKHSETVHFG